MPNLKSRRKRDWVKYIYIYLFIFFQPFSPITNSNPSRHQCENLSYLPLMPTKQKSIIRKITAPNLSDHPSMMENHRQTLDSENEPTQPCKPTWGPTSPNQWLSILMEETNDPASPWQTQTASYRQSSKPNIPMAETNNPASHGRLILQVATNHQNQASPWQKQTIQYPDGMPRL